MNAYVYVISSPLGLLKLGVATDPKRRLRNLQVGSPVPLELAAQYLISDRPTAQAVAAVLQERFRERRERGEWFRATPLEVRQAITERSVIGLYRPSEATEREAARAAAAAAKAEAAGAIAAATTKERRRLRRKRWDEAARLLVQGATQAAAGEAVGVSDRTIRNWLKLKGFQTAVRRARERAERQRRARIYRSVSRRYRRAGRPVLPAERRRASSGRTRRFPSGSNQARSDGRDARVPAPPDTPVRLVNESGKTVGRTSASNAERMAAALEPRNGPLKILPA